MSLAAWFSEIHFLNYLLNILTTNKRVKFLLVIINFFPFVQSCLTIVSWYCRFRDPQPDYSAFREASYGHSTLEIKNRTHAFYHWNRNDDGKKVATDSFKLHNQYWWVKHSLLSSADENYQSYLLKPKKNQLLKTISPIDLNQGPLRQPILILC